MWRRDCILLFCNVFQYMRKLSYHIIECNSIAEQWAVQECKRDLAAIRAKHSTTGKRFGGQNTDWWQDQTMIMCGTNYCTMFCYKYIFIEKKLKSIIYFSNFFNHSFSVDDFKGWND